MAASEAIDVVSHLKNSVAKYRPGGEFVAICKRFVRTIEYIEKTTSQLEQFWVREDSEVSLAVADFDSNVR